MVYNNIRMIITKVGDDFFQKFTSAHKFNNFFFTYPTLRHKEKFTIFATL